MGLLPWPAPRHAPSDLPSTAATCWRLSARERRAIVGRDIAMIFQEPMTSLNPCFTVGFQIAETLRIHSGMDRKARRGARARAARPGRHPRSASAALDAFPHQLSGGMSQRVMIAMAIACNPRLLIADEPTTALDVTIQAQILDLLLRLQRERGMALVLITHDMGVVAEIADRVVVLYAGQEVETQPAGRLFAHAAPSLHRGAARGAARARDGNGACRRFPAWCPASSTGRTAACSRRAARIATERLPGHGAAARGSRGRTCALPDTTVRRRTARTRGRAVRDRVASRRATLSRRYESGAACSRATGRRAGGRPASRSPSKPARTLAVVGESGCGKIDAGAPGGADRTAEPRARC